MMETDSKGGIGPSAPYESATAVCRATDNAAGTVTECDETCAFQTVWARSLVIVN